jgi:hypothetical protein
MIKQCRIASSDYMLDFATVIGNSLNRKTVYRGKASTKSVAGL